MKCLECKKEITKTNKWCSLKCKKKTWVENYMNAGVVKNWQAEEDEKKQKYLNSSKYKKFMKRVEKVGFIKALRISNKKSKREQNYY